MRRTISMTTLAAILLLALPQVSNADHYGRGGGWHHGGGAPWWWIVPPLVYLSTLPDYRYPDPQPVIIQQPAPTVIMEPPAQYTQQAVAPQPAPYWYYCVASNGYYPYVAACPGGWRQVPATPPGVAP